jgi:hypothetical protein
MSNWVVFSCIKKVGSLKTFSTYFCRPLTTVCPLALCVSLHHKEYLEADSGKVKGAMTAAISPPRCAFVHLLLFMAITSVVSFMGLTKECAKLRVE